MHNNLRGKLNLQRIENMVGDGIPDVLTLRSGKVTFCELKVAERIPARPGTPLLGDKKGLNVEQRNWHLDWTMNGGRSMIIVGIQDQSVHFALWGHLADRVNAMSYNDMHSACAIMSNGVNFWRRLLEAL
jgi:hypothetical protein